MEIVEKIRMDQRYRTSEAGTVFYAVMALET
jgi:hypothetical protein